MDNSIEVQVSKFFNNVSEEIGNFKKTLVDTFNGFDINKDDVIKLIKMFVQQ